MRPQITPVINHVHSFILPGKNSDTQQSGVQFGDARVMFLIRIHALGQLLDLGTCIGQIPWFCYMHPANSMIWMHAQSQLHDLDTCIRPNLWFGYMHWANSIVWMPTHTPFHSCLSVIYVWIWLLLHLDVLCRHTSGSSSVRNFDDQSPLANAVQPNCTLIRNPPKS